MAKSQVERERREGMLYSHCLPSGKGPLGSIWVAAYFFKKLKKAQVTSTDISSSVGKQPSLFILLFYYVSSSVTRFYCLNYNYNKRAYFMFCKSLLLYDCFSRKQWGRFCLCGIFCFCFFICCSIP